MWHGTAARRHVWRLRWPARQGHQGKYISDFPDEILQGHEKFICVPHLGASTAEAEDNCAIMAADQIMDYIETGTIKNSVNMPAA